MQFATFCVRWLSWLLVHTESVKHTREQHCCGCLNLHTQQDGTSWPANSKEAKVRVDDIGC